MNNAFLEKALEGKNNLWRYVLTLTLVIILNIGSTVILIFIAFFYTGTLDFLKWPPNIMIIVAMVPFGFSSFGLWVGLKYLHKRSWAGLINPLGRMRWGRLWLSFLIWFALSGLSDFIIWLWQPENLKWSFRLETFLPFCILVLILVPIQTSTEEIIFRGYLTQGLGVSRKGLLFPLLIPSIIFGLLHSFNVEAQVYDYSLAISFYILMGLLLGWITIKSEGIELALGLHLANNVYASLITTYPGSSIASPALFTYVHFSITLSSIVFLADAVIYLVILLLISRHQKTKPV
jgi:uncharacterized protein